jgi:FkbM family methyltransferase
MSFSSYVYGSGTFAAKVATDLVSAGGEFLGFVDHMHVGREIQVGPMTWIVKSTNELQFFSGVCILGVCNLHGDLDAISRKLKIESLEIVLLTPVEFYNSPLGKKVEISHYWLENDSTLFHLNKTEIDRFRGLLYGEDSKELYDSILNYREFGLLANLPKPLPIEMQYLALDLGTPPKNLRAIDAGACKGENLKPFIDAGLDFEAYYAFEPDALNLHALKDVLLELDLDSVEIIQAAVWSRIEELSFSDLGDPSSGLNVNAASKVLAVDIDSFLMGRDDINFIKMDIEGAEKEALLGASKTLVSSLPHLAISVYHKPCDLWELGLLIEEIVPNKYKYHLRMYGHQTFDTILYAVPK